jgi:hypothetical protein
MEELRRIAAEYYGNTVSIRFFGIKGGLPSSVSPIYISGVLFKFYIQRKHHHNVTDIHWSFYMVESK